MDSESSQSQGGTKVITPLAPTSVTMPSPVSQSPTINTAGVYPAVNQPPSQEPAKQFITGSSIANQGLLNSEPGSKSGLISLIAGASSIVLIMIFILTAGSLFGSSSGEGSFVLQLLAVLVLSSVGVVFGFLNQKNDSNRNGLGALGLALASVMFVLTLIVGTYYMKIKIELNKYKSKYESSSTIRYDSSN